MRPSVSTATPDAASQRDIRLLADRVARDDGAPPLSDQARAQLGSSAVVHVVARLDDVVVGYAQRAGDSIELVAEPAAAQALIESALVPGARIWTHGSQSRLIGPLAEAGMIKARELLQLRRPLDADHPLAEDAALPDGVEIRAFEPGPDDAALLDVNSAAFANHPEQGAWTQADLRARVAETWFRAEGVLLATRGEQLLGFHWTKVHDAGPASGLGEVYVLAVAPAAQGTGLGRALLTRGLRHLAGYGCPGVLLYVEADNTGAVRLYERADFEHFDIDVQWATP